MARIRSIKPGFCTDLATARLSRDARLFFLLLLTEADDKGRFVDSGKKLAGNLYPHDEKVTGTLVARWLKECVGVGMVCLYEVDGARFGHVVNFAEHQKPQHPSPSKLPACPLHVNTGGGHDDDRRRPGGPHENRTSDSRPEVGSRNWELGEGESSSSSSGEEPPPAARLDEEDFSVIVARRRLARNREHVAVPEHWLRTVAANVRAEYGAEAAGWAGTQVELADRIEPEPAPPAPSLDCATCANRGVYETPEGFVKCPHDDAVGTATGG